MSLLTQEMTHKVSSPEYTRVVLSENTDILFYYTVIILYFKFLNDLKFRFFFFSFFSAITG